MTTDPKTDRSEETGRLRRALEALEAQRESLGASVFETAAAPLRARLAELGRSQGPARRIVTALLGDIAGFTALGEGLDAEILSDTVNSVWRELDAVIARYGGTVDKHMGDSVLALWGVERSAEDDPVSAVRAALEMQRSLSALDAGLSAAAGFEPGSSMRIRIAVHTGPALVDRTGDSDELSAIGDTINTLSRLEKLAPREGILVSDEVWASLGGLFEGAAQERKQVRGRTAPVGTWIVTGPSRPVQAVQDSPAGGSSMVGRTAELDRLLSTFEKSTSHSSPGLAVVAGDAGIGKSRLAAEFVSRIRLADPGAGIIRGRCSPDTASTPYGVLRSAVSAWLGLDENADIPEVFGRLSDITEGRLDTRRTETAARLLGFGKPPEGAVQSADGEIISLFRESFRGRRLALVLEDVHWADDATIRLVETLVRERPGRGFLAVCTTRPAFFKRFPRWGSPTAGHELVRLAPLSRAEAGRLARSSLPAGRSLPDGVLETAVVRSDGNPLHLKELLGMFLDREAAGKAAPAGDDPLQQAVPGAADIPSTLAGVLQARLDALTAEERSVTKAASVLGRSAWSPAVARLLDMSAEDAARIMGTLAAREVMAETGARVFGSAEYSFLHALIRDASYDSILLKDRASLHASAACWLDEHAEPSSDFWQGLIARHYELAGEPGRASARYLIAAEGAFGRCAYHDAVQICEKGLLLTGTQPGRTRSFLLVCLGMALEKLSRYRDAEKALAEAASSAEATDDEIALGRICNVLSWIFFITGRAGEAEKTAMKALEHARRSGDRRTLARSLSRIADLSGEDGYRHAASLYEQSLAIYREMGDRAGQATCLLNLGNHAYGFREYSDARKWYGEALSIFRLIDHTWGIANCLANLGLLEKMDGRPGEAVRHAREALRLSLSIGDHENAAICLSNIGDAMRQTGRNAEALDNYIRSLGESARIGTIPQALHTMYGTADLLLETEQPEWAARLLAHIDANPEAAGRQLAQLVMDRLETRIPLLVSPKVLDGITRDGRKASTAEIASRLASEFGRRRADPEDDGTPDVDVD